MQTVTCTCTGSATHATLEHRAGRHCPNSRAVNLYFSRCGDMDITITEDGYVCNNGHLTISRESEGTSSDEELQELLETSGQHAPVGGAGPHSHYITADIEAVVKKLGSVLMRNLAVLFPEVYTLFLSST